MSNTTNDYIFCPLCGGVNWLTNKTKVAPDGGRLTYFKCKSCKKFNYYNHTRLVDHPFLAGVTQTTRYSVEATVQNYKILVKYHDKTTSFYDDETEKLLLHLNTCVTFNWYKNEDLIEKIKKYLLFS